MIDPHVHLRDWQQQQKETVKHGLEVACRAGLDAVFEMPNTEPPIISSRLVKERIALADAAGVSVFHGLYAGLTAGEDQIREVVKAYHRYFPRIVGLKLFAGRSTGGLSVISETGQRRVFEVLVKSGYRGVVAVHCEKEALFRNHLWNPDNPATHCLVRPPASEVASVQDMIRLAAETGFRGTLHICHISVPEAVLEIEKQRSRTDFRITCGITPHHGLLHDKMMKTSPGLKMNPPLRPVQLQQQMLQLLLSGRIDWIETDHAPHTAGDKPLASGIPGLPFLPHFIRLLQECGIEPSLLESLTHNRICTVFGIDINKSGRVPDYHLAAEYDYDPYAEAAG